MSEQPPVEVSLENRLMGQGIYLTAWEPSDDGVSLEYEVVSELPAVTSDEVGTVVRTVLEIAAEREEWTPETLEVTSTTTDGDVRGTWHVEGEWFRALYDELSEVEFSQRVLETVAYEG